MNITQIKPSTSLLSCNTTISCFPLLFFFEQIHDKLKPFNMWVKKTEKNPTFKIRPSKLPIKSDVLLEID